MISFHLHCIELETINIRVTINGGDIDLDFYQQNQWKSYKCKLQKIKREKGK